MYAEIAAITAWLDRESGLRDSPLADDASRVLKVGEEIGEAYEALRLLGSVSEANGRAVGAFIGMTGQNPRKGVTHSQAELLAELADVAVTALCAIQHFTQSADDTERIILAKLASIVSRSPAITALACQTGSYVHTCRNGYCDPVCMFA